ncbi:MAG: hypothetical protein ACOZJX_11160 [Pseudomonadota bacterium]
MEDLPADMPGAAAPEKTRWWPRFQFTVAIALILLLLAVTGTFCAKLVLAQWSPANGGGHRGAVYEDAAAALPALKVSAITAPATRGATSTLTVEHSLPPVPQAPPIAHTDGGTDHMDAIANTMTALGTAVAVIALLLTVGTSWFAGQQQKLNDQLKVAKADTVRIALREQIENQRDAARDHLADAKRAALKWLASRTRGDVLALQQLEIEIDLEQLLAADRPVRRRAFLRLADKLGHSRQELPDIESFAEMCHKLQLMHVSLSALQRQADDIDTALDLREFADQARRGLACRIFDPGEHERVFNNP